MELILSQISGGLTAGLHYLSVVSALMLPDHCAALESADGRSSQKKYEAWFEAWLAAKYRGWLTASDMYRLRCGAVHQGILAPTGMQYTRVVFMVDRPNVH